MNVGTNSPTWCLAQISDSLFQIALHPDLAIAMHDGNESPTPQIIVDWLDFHFRLGKESVQSCNAGLVASKILDLVGEDSDRDLRTNVGFGTDPRWTQARILARQYLSQCTGYTDWDHLGTPSA